MKKYVKKADGWLAAAIAAVALLIGLLLWLLAPAGAQVQVQVDGQVTMTLPLAVDATVTIPGVGGDNTLVIAGGTARVTAADCPDELCVHHRAIRRAGESILCLPHRVAVTVVGGTPVVDGEV